MHVANCNEKIKTQLNLLRTMQLLSAVPTAFSSQIFTKEDLISKALIQME